MWKSFFSEILYNCLKTINYRAIVKYTSFQQCYKFMQSEPCRLDSRIADSDVVLKFMLKIHGKY